MKKSFTLFLLLFSSMIKAFCRPYTVMLRTAVLAILFIAGFNGVCLAQPTVLGTALVNGSYTTYNLNTIGNFRQVKMQATSNAVSGTLNWEFCLGTAGSPDYSTNWRPYTAGLTLTGYNLLVPPVGGTSSALFNSGFGGQSGLVPAVTAGNYYTFNITANGGNNHMSVLETTYSPETFSSVTQSPATVGGTVSPVITVVMSSAPASNVYIRYSTNNFASSVLVPLVFVGATGTANIPAQPAGTIVRYYVYNSPKTSAEISTDVSASGELAHDMATLNLNNNGGANYQYTVLPVTVNATNTASDASYLTLKDAFDAINLGTHTGVINIWISGNTTENLTAVLNASGGPSSYTAVTVRPSGLSRIITGNLAAPLIDLNGADNVTIDGLNDGSNSLVIANSNTSATAGTSTIRMYNGAAANTVQNCILEGSATTASGGIVFFSTGTNTNILISSNTLRPSGFNLPLYAVFGSGTDNTAITISNNNIQDYFSAAQNSHGVFASTGSNAWTVSNNRFFQSVPRTINTAAAGVRVIMITAGGGYTINNNVIGFSNSGGTGTTTYTTTQLNNLIVGIQLTGDANTSTIQGNVISNFTVNSASNTTAVPGIFTGIFVFAGAANITANTIGAATGTGAISVTCSVTGLPLLVAGISAASLSPNTVNIQNNTIGAINLAAASGTVQYNFIGINAPAAVTAAYTIANNLIGSTSTANSINVGTASTAATSFSGIVCNTTGAISIPGNTVQNCTVSGSGASQLTGILTSASTGVVSVTNNNIISCSHAGSSTFTGISNTAAASILTISGNTLRNLTVNNVNTQFIAITNSGAVTSAININNNQLGNASGTLVNYTVANTATLTGITNTAGTSSAALTIQSNDFRITSFSVSTSGAHTYINNSAATLSQNINTNTFTALNITTTNGITFISNSVSLGATGTKIIKDNAIVTSFTKTGGGGFMYFYLDIGSSIAGATITNEGNNFSNITINGATTLMGWSNSDGSGTVPTKNIFNNTFSNISNINPSGSAVFPLQVTNGTGSIYSNTITNCTAPNTVTAMAVTSGSFNIYSNNINTLSSSTSFAGVTGISVSGGTAQNVYYNTIHTLGSTATSTTVSAVTISGGTTVRVYKNKVYGISNSALALVSGGAYGINITGGSTVSVYNNLIGNLSAGNANFDDAIRGISVGGGTTVNVYYNTVYINASSTGASFGSSALYANTTPTLDMRNNILYNISTPGSGASGKTVAYRRNGATLTSYSNNSDNNFFYAGIPGAKNFIFFNGTNSDQTLALYQARVAAPVPRDTTSVTASLATNFISLVGSSLNFLHLNGTSAAESGAETITGFTDDYDDEPRFGNAGYTGTGTRADIGADEFESIVCPAVPTITGISSVAPYYAGDVITITGTNLTGITYATINDINATIGTVTATTAELTIPTTMADSVGAIQVAFSSSCTFSNTFNFVFAGYITLGTNLTGNWNTAAIWRNNAIPVANAPATINVDDDVTLDVSADPIKFTILAGATFTHQNNGLVFGTTFLNNTTVNGTLTVDNATTPVLAVANRFISPRLMINSGGIFTNNSANAAAVNIANFYVYAGGTYNHNAVGSTAAGVVNDFPGSTLRVFGNTSSVVITKWANGASPGTGLPSSGSPGWGHLTINVANLAGSWNQFSGLTNIQGNLTILATGGTTREFRLAGSSANTTNVGGNILISGGIFTNTAVNFSSNLNVSGNITVSGGTFNGNSSGTGVSTIVVSGNFVLSSGVVNGISSSSSSVTGSITVNGASGFTMSGGSFAPTAGSSQSFTTTVANAFTMSNGTVISPGSSQTHIYSLGSLLISGGSFGMSASSNTNFTLTTTGSGNISVSGNGAMLSTSAGNITINCGGNFTLASSATTAFALQSSSTTSRTYALNIGGNFSNTGTGLFVGGSGSSPASISFTGGVASVSYNAAPGVMAVTSPVNVKNNFFVTSGKTLTLLSSILPASSSTSNNWNFTVNTGATLVCGTNEIGTNAGTARTSFTLQTGATLRTAHAGGVWNTTTGAASITTTAVLASFSDGATYEFNGTAAQVSSAFATTPSATPSNVANFIVNNTNAAGVTLSASYNVTSALQLQTGILTLGTFNITAASLTGAPYSSTKMVNTNSTGMLGLLIPAGVSNTIFPVGNGTDYTPANYAFSANSDARYLSVRAAKPRNTNDLSPTNYINNRWWNTGLSVTTGTYTYTAIYTYINGDMVGTAASIRLNRWNGTAWVNDAASVVNNTNFTITSGTLNESTGTLAATAQWVGRTYVAPAIYTWTNPVNGSWLDAGKWTPVGIPGSGDGVVFDEAGSYTVFSMPVGITLTQMHNTGSTLNLRASGAGTVNISTVSAAPQFIISAGASTTLDSLNAVNINLLAGATGSAGGSLNLHRTTHTVTVVTAGSLVFPSGGYFSYGNSSNPGFSGHPFGSTGTNGAVLFNNGSICECFEGSNPFGAAVADRIVTFNGGSLFRYSDPTVSLPSLSGRTYANFEYNANKVSSSFAANSFICDSLTVTQGTFNMNLQGTPTPDHSIRGNINVVTGANLSFSPASAGTVNMNSGANQVIWGAGSFNVNALSTFDINAGTTVSLQKNMGVNSTGTMPVNGTLVLTGENFISSPLVAGGTVAVNNGGTLSIQSVDGISNAAVGNIRSTIFTYNTGGNFIYSGNANQVTGNRLPVTLNAPSVLTIANTGTAPANVVTLTTNNTTTPRINLSAGQFNAGTGGTLVINGGTNLVVGSGGNQLLSGTATDNIIRFASNGAVSGTPELWNVTIGNSGGGVDFQNNARINGILLINSSGFVSPNAPRYQTGSFLVYNTGGSYNRNVEWGNNAGLGNPGYPHHVTIQNGTTLNFLNNTTFNMGCGGNLTLGTTTAGTLVLTDYIQPHDLFVRGNINIGGTAAGTLTMSNSIGCDLYLTGNWTRTATGNVNFGFGNGRSVYFDGSTDATITASGGQYFPYVRLEKAAKANKVILADHVSIGFEVTFTRGTLDLGTNNKFFSLLSNVNTDARVDVSDSANTDFIYGASDNTGQFIVQRYFPARRAWRLVTAPLKPGGGTHSISQAWQERGNAATGLDYTAANWVASVAADTAAPNFATQITGGTAANGFDLSPNNNSSIRFYNGGGAWNTPANTNNTSVNSQEGWLLFVRGDRETYGEINNQFKAATITTLRPRGQIFLGQKTITASGLQTVGNPYASAVDYFSMTRTGTGWPANPTYYVWDPSLGGALGVGAWVTLTWNGTNFTRSSPYGGGNYDNRYIASGAAIMVDFPAGGGTLSMNEANKNTDSTTTAFRPVRQLRTSLLAKDADNTMYVADAALNLFGSQFNDNYDLDDARKLSNVNENICLRRNSGYLSIERKKLNGDGDTLFYFINKLQKKDYQLRFEMDNIEVPAATAAFLEDTYLKTKTPVSLSGATEAGFTVTNDSGSAAAERFRLVFRRSVWYSHIAADILNSDVAISWSVPDELNIEKYEIERSDNGSHFTTIASQLSRGNSAVPVSYSGLDVSPAPGEYHYRIKSTSKNGIITYSDVVKVKVVKSGPQLFVFPNPVSNNVIQLQLNKAMAGSYTTVLYANNGQVINNEVIAHTGGTATKIIQPKQRLVSGSYQLMVTAPDGQVSVIKLAVADK